MSSILTFNAGSSSLKIGVFDTKKSLAALASASIEGIGQKTQTFMSTQLSDVSTSSSNVSCTNHTEAASYALQWLKNIDLIPLDVSAVGHRIVHGGALYHSAQLVSQQMLDDIRPLAEIDPEHMPASLATIEKIQESLPNVPHVVCFDTAFYRDLPKVASRLPLPRKYHDLGLRRYGFHGLSYKYLLQEFRSNEGVDAANGRIIFAHLGSGASLCATKHGSPVDTTMGFSPAGGIPMSTRSGDIDPSVAWFLHRTAGQSPSQIQKTLSQESGLLGVSGSTSDMRTLLELQQTDQRASEAVELFCYSVAKSIGSLSVTIGGLDSLVFSGGIGERSAEIRQRVCSNLKYLGVVLDDDRNANSERLISRLGSPAGVHVIPTNESQMIARETELIVKGRN